MAATAASQWNFAVPIGQANEYPGPQRTDTLDSHGLARSGGYRELKSAVGSRASDYNLQSDTDSSGNRRPPAANGNPSRKRSVGAMRQKESAPAVDDSAWIHRDKLAQIESKEMAEAGILPRSRPSSANKEASRPNSRSQSRSRAKQNGSKDRHASARNSEEHQRNGQPLEYDDSRLNRVSTILAADEEEHEQAHGSAAAPLDFELRTAEEVAAEQELQQWRQPSIRPSASRLPISRNSPVPVPHTVLERDLPLSRNRIGSGAWNGQHEDGIAYNRQVPRSQSAGSQVLEDFDNSGSPTYSRPNSSHMQQSPLLSSPLKSRIPSMGAPTSGARKNSTPAVNEYPPRTTSHNKPPSRSGPPKENGRPISSHISRPSTSHSPEGEAPWIASMYKPDPRLPPDQQMLPTHTKRMLQEQWEKDGRMGTAYDRDFELLNDEQIVQPAATVLSLEQRQLDLEHPAPALSTRLSLSPQVEEPKIEWPLATPRNETRSETASLRLGTCGGYRITPTIPQSPTIVQRPTPSLQEVEAAPNPRMPDFDEKDEARPKKACCCIVM